MTGGTFKDLGDGRILFTPEPDKDGYTGRECPSEECGKYFKIVASRAEGIDPAAPSPLTCPYCGHQRDTTEFATKAQIEYGNSVIEKDMMALLLAPLKQVQADIMKHRNKGGLLTINLEIGEPGAPLKEYSELQDLETYVTCDDCGDKYAIYGVYGYCPHCAAHNSMKILENNFRTVEKILYLAEEKNDLASQLRESALEGCVKAIDGWGRAICQRFEDRAKSAKAVRRISFQDIKRAVDDVKEQFGIDIASPWSSEEYNSVNGVFQKRHLLAHRSGVIDERFIEKTGADAALLGRKVVVVADEVRNAVCCLKRMAEYLAQELETKP
jgi:hypothetical protein